MATRDRDDVMVADEEDDGFKGAGDDVFGGEGLGGERDDDSSQDASEASQDGLGLVGKVSKDKKTWNKVTPHQKVVNVILRRARKDAIPPLKQLLKGKWGNEIAIKDIALFIGDEQDDEVMAELAKKCPIRNCVNLSAEVRKKRVQDVAAQIVESGRMYFPIHVARIKGKDGTVTIQCTSGRHRAVGLAILYGVDVKIPVYMEDQTISEARDAVVFANQTRSAKALERAEHSVLQSVQGDVDTAQEDLYYRTVTGKDKAKKYCVFSVISRGYPAKLEFPVSTGSTRKGGRLTTLANVEGFWGAALEWTDGMEFKEFDSGLKATIKFLNALVAAMQKEKGFDPSAHLATKQLVAIGKYYRTYKEITGSNAFRVVGGIAKCIVKMGPIGGEKSEKTYNALTKALAMSK